MVRRLVRLPLHSWERHAVIGRRHDQRVVQLPGLLQLRKNPAQVIVEMLHLDRVIQHVVADHVVVRPILRHAVDVRELLAHAPADTGLVAAMRLGCPVPKRPRLALGRVRGGEKLGKVAGVVVVGNRPCRWLGLLLLPRLAGDLSRLAVCVVGVARPPAFAGVAGRVAVGLEQFHPAAELDREKRHVVSRLLELPRVAPGQDDRPRRRALGVGRVGAAEKNPLPGHAIERRGAHPAAAVRAGMAERPVIGNGKKNVRPLRRLAGGEPVAEQQNRGNNAFGQGVHRRLILPAKLLAKGKRTCQRAKQPYSLPRADARLTQW